MILADNLAELRRRVSPYGNITLIAATKTQSIETVRAFCETAPEFELGENRVQELREKYFPERVWHMIGRLQTNKVKYIIDKVKLIQSLDREELAYEIDRQAARVGKTQGCLVEINTADEATKGGIPIERTEDFIYGLSKFEHIKIEGLMSVMPNLGECAALEKLYDKLYAAYERAKRINTPNADIKYLSAGMSNDYNVALDHGANMLRLGRLLFGERTKI